MLKDATHDRSALRAQCVGIIIIINTPCGYQHTVIINQVQAQIKYPLFVNRTKQHHQPCNQHGAPLRVPTSICVLALCVAAVTVYGLYIAEIRTLLKSQSKIL